MGNVLADSSYYIERLRAGEDPMQDFVAYADDFDFHLCGVIEAEVLRGMKVRRHFEQMVALMDTMLYIPTTNRIWRRVSDLAWHLDRRGKGMQITDMVIAVSALEVDAALLTLDSDFLRVPGLRVISELADLS